MKSLPRELRDQLAKTTEKARTQAEEAVRAAIENLAVHEKDYRPHMSVEQRQLRNRLRARGRALGDDRDTRSGVQEITRLVEAAAYEHWHRLLFTRFLAGNDLLFTDAENGNVAVTLEECEELAPELGAKDGFELACRFSSETLPGVFRRDEPVLEITLAANHTIALRKLVESLPDEIFRAQDALGWTYQFWQTRRKKEVNESDSTIGAAELSPVTQLFTEDYMVEFLLHNTLGAWWAGRQATVSSSKFQFSRCPSEDDARRAASLPPKDGLPGIDWTYLRFVNGDTEGPEAKASSAWRPAAGTFDGWPTAAKDITFLDPCMGSGHFPVFALPILARLRMEEEGLSVQEAVAAVLRENIHGLELDPRCCQIGAFNLALAAWKLGGYQVLPPLQIACSGIAPQGKKEDWLAIAAENQKLQRGMERLYSLFNNAPSLGSLINPRAGQGNLLEAAFHELQPLLEKALEQETTDDTAHEMAVTARGLAKAAEILAGQFTLIATNFPYLKRAKQAEELKNFATLLDEDSHGELATTFLVKSLGDLEEKGTLAVVTPQSLSYQRYYVRLRKRILEENRLRFVVKLGPGAFETISGEIVQPILLVMDNTRPEPMETLGYADFVREAHSTGKASALKDGSLALLYQKTLFESREHKISSAGESDLPDLAKYGECYQGICTGDIPRFGSCFWEIPREEDGWVLQHSTPENRSEASGCTQILFWEKGKGVLYDQIVERLGEAGVSSWIRGLEAWGSQGIAVAQMQSLRSGHYTGKCFDNNTAVIIPKDQNDRAAIFEYCRSGEYRDAVLEIDQSIKISNKTLLKVPFDLAYWQKVAAEKYPDGLPKPHSDDPTQWLFNGHPKGSDSPLHVAVARLLAYQWPRQTGSSFPDCPALTEPDGLEAFADNDGIVCLSALHRELPAAARLRKLLSAALGSYDERALIQATGSTKSNLEDWLRDDFFKQHVALFHNRPFVWHLWDGLKDGFHVLVNYHRLDHATLNALTYTYLGDWIREQKAAAADDVPGAAERLKSATHLQGRLAAILEGEAPLDLFVRWKPLSKQAIGWHPDLNDGIRLNIRPFLLAGDLGAKGAGLFRTKPGITLDPDKADRGTEPLRDKDEYPWFWCDKPPGTNPVPGKEYSGRRWNGVHLTLDYKRGKG